MKRLLTIELQKLLKNRASKVLIFTYFILLSCIALLSSINFNIIGMDFRLADMGIFNFPYIWHLNTFVAAALKFFLAVVIVSMMANEYTYGTLKQNLIDGLSKEEFIKSKFYTVLLFSAASTIFIVIMTLILGYSFSSYTELSIVTRDLEYIGAYFLKLVAFFSFCLFVGILIKRSAFALGFIIVWFLIEEIFIRGMLNWQVTDNKETTSFIIGFLPLDAMFSLIKEPFTRFEAYQALEMQVSGVEKVRFYGIHWYEYAIVLFWTAFFIYMSYRILKKRDL
jgi:ABC-type transport system involved in multi-copper enzyme maturation permease subunit